MYLKMVQHKQNVGVHRVSGDENRIDIQSRPVFGVPLHGRDGERAHNPAKLLLSWHPMGRNFEIGGMVQN